MTDYAERAKRALAELEAERASIGSPHSVIPSEIKQAKVNALAAEANAYAILAQLEAEPKREPHPLCKICNGVGSFGKTLTCMDCNGSGRARRI